MDRLRKFGAWLYNWATVIAGTVTGFLAFVLPLVGDLLNFLDIVGPVDLTAYGVSAVTAAKITSVVALLKGLHAYYQFRSVA